MFVFPSPVSGKPEVLLREWSTPVINEAPSSPGETVSLYLLQ